jgi:hypothetical protein
VYLLILRPWVFPALGRSNHVRSAGSGVWLASFELQERASDQEHAASATSNAFSVSVRVDGEYQARGESLQLAVEWSVARRFTAFLELIYLLYMPIAFSRIRAEMK